MPNRSKIGKVCLTIGLLLVAAALFYAGSVLWTDWQAGVASEKALAELTAAHSPQPSAPPRASAAPADSAPPETPKPVLDPSREMPTAEVNGQAYIGTLSVPSLGLTLPVISQWSDARLNLAPCRYAGSAYGSGFVIAGHNYRSHFAPLYRVAIGDEVCFTDVEGMELRYTVAETGVLPPTAIEEMTSTSWDLTLFTCTTSGEARFAVRCARAAD